MSMVHPKDRAGVRWSRAGSCRYRPSVGPHGSGSHVITAIDSVVISVEGTFRGFQVEDPVRMDCCWYLAFVLENHNQCVSYDTSNDGSESPKVQRLRFVKSSCECCVRILPVEAFRVNPPDPIDALSHEDVLIKDPSTASECLTRDLVYPTRGVAPGDLVGRDVVGAGRWCVCLCLEDEGYAEGC